MIYVSIRGLVGCLMIITEIQPWSVFAFILWPVEMLFLTLPGSSKATGLYNLYSSSKFLIHFVPLLDTACSQNINVYNSTMGHIWTFFLLILINGKNI